MKYSERSQTIAGIVGMMLIFAALSIIVMAIFMCFTKSILLLKGITGVGTFMAIVVIGLFYAFWNATVNDDGEIEL